MDYGRHKIKTKPTPLMIYKGYSVYLTKKPIKLFTAWGVALHAGYDKKILASPSFQRLPRAKQEEVLDHEITERRYFKKHLVERVDELGDEAHQYAEQQVARRKAKKELIPW